MLLYKIAYICTLIISFLSVLIFFKTILKPNKNVIKISNTVLIFCIFGTILLNFALYGSFGKLGHFILFFASQLLCFFISICCLKQAVEFNEEYFVNYGLFKKTVFNYCEIEKYYIKNSFLVIIVKNKKIRISTTLCNNNLFEFFKVLKQKTNKNP